MAETVELKWKAEKDKSWISVNPTAGTGSQNVTISITPSTTYGDTDTAGTVTFTCIDCNTPTIKKVTVTRCVPSECVVDTRTTSYTDVTKDVEACDDHINVEIPYTEKITYKTQGCQPKENKFTATTSYTFSTNETSSPTAYTFYYPSQSVNPHATVTVNQGTGPCTTPCGCGKLSIDKDSLTWPWDDASTNKTVTIKITSDCSDRVTITNVTTALTDFTVSYNSSTKVITAKPKSTNPGASGSKTGEIVISYTADTDCTKKITLTQESQGDPCVGKTVTINVNPNTLTCDGGSATFTATVS